MLPPRPIHRSVTRRKVAELSWIYETTTRNPGICLSCGCIGEGVEPDARNYKCEHCGETSVWGATECLMAGFYHDRREDQ